MSLYGNAALREAGDLDLLVRPHDIVATKRLLVQRGFRPIFPTSTPSEAAYLAALTGSREVDYLTTHSEHHLVARQGMVNVDLH